MSFAGDDVGAIVIDAGSSEFKAGYAGDDMPKVRARAAHTAHSLFAAYWGC